VKFALLDAENAFFPARFLCEILGVSPAGYYAWRSRPAPARAKEDDALVAEIKHAHRTGRGTYGSPRIHRELRANGRNVGKKRGERLMQREGIAARRKRRFRITTDSKHTHPIAPNLLERDFTAAVPNARRVTDVTYIWTREGWLYLAAILDLFSRRVVGWAAGANNDRALALQALEQARKQRLPTQGLVHHSDRGSVYASSDYADAITKIGAISSMSRKGDCYDNAVAESFFATIKGEMIDHVTFATRRAAIIAIADYIDNFYNPIRRHSSIGDVSPIEFELKFRKEQMAA
jgi:transposase InsO family protein